MPSTQANPDQPGGQPLQRRTAREQANRRRGLTQLEQGVCATASARSGRCDDLDACQRPSLEAPSVTLLTADERVVEQGRIITAAGVSAGIDMALVLAERLAGTEIAQAVQLSIEYDPDPPFDAGSPEKASAEVVERVRRPTRREPSQATR